MIPYRVEQVWKFLRQRPSDEEAAWVRSVLGPRQQALFFAQEAGDQAHAIRVARTLMAEGKREPRLLEAALLHDAGKAPGVSLPYRILMVLLKKLWPAWLERLSPHREGWLAPLARAYHHPAIGAEQARAAGCDPDVVRLIAYHQSREVELGDELQQMLLALQEVDDRS